MKQGKCIKCKVRYIWEREIPSKLILTCPTCRYRLQATTHLLKWPIINKEPNVKLRKS
jgi:DNA-directed RNA polymerase subunit RPC12/RpoP